MHMELDDYDDNTQAASEYWNFSHNIIARSRLN